MQSDFVQNQELNIPSFKHEHLPPPAGCICWRKTGEKETKKMTIASFQAFRQEGVDGQYLRVNTFYERWEIAENLQPSYKLDSTSFVTLSCYTLCPANLMEITNMAGHELSWSSSKWRGIQLLLKCTEHSKDD